MQLSPCEPLSKFSPPSTNLSRFLKPSVCLRSQKVPATWRGFYISSLSSSSVKLIGIYWLSQSQWQKLSWLLMILSSSSPWARRAPSGALLQDLAEAKLFVNVSQTFFLPFHCQFPPKCSLWAAVFLTFCLCAKWLISQNHRQIVPFPSFC